MSYRFASLTSGLLARKGSAYPAMTSHAGGNGRPLSEQVSFVTLPDTDAEPANQAFAPAAVLERAGFRSAVSPSPAAPPAPPARAIAVAPPARAKPFAPDHQPCNAAEACPAADQAALDPAKRFHVSVRLRQGHFVRLKLASAQLRRPSQEIVADALSAYFRSLDPQLFGDCACSRD